MRHKLTWCEIPVTDMQRAKAFYGEVLQCSIREENMENFNMAIFEGAPEEVSGMLVKGDGYEPSQTGAVVYLQGIDDLDATLKRATDRGSKVLWPKTPIDDGSKGYFAQFLDSEGNRIGLYGMN